MELGDRAFEVEWCSDIPRDEFGDMLPDAATYHCRILRSREAAERIAREVLPRDAFGSVRITPVVRVDPFGDRIPATYLWEPCGESEFIEA